MFVGPLQEVKPSEVQGWTDIPFGAMQSCYAASKLLQILLAREPASKLNDDGVVLNLLSPDLCYPQFTCEDDSWMDTILKLPLARSTVTSSRPLLAVPLAGQKGRGAYKALMGLCLFLSPGKMERRPSQRTHLKSSTTPPRNSS